MPCNPLKTRNKMRTNAIIGIIGGRGTGKTTYLLGDQSLNIQGLLEASSQQKHLIIDTIDHPMYQGRVPVLDHEGLKKFGLNRDAKGTARIFPAIGESMNDILSLVSNYFWNGTLVLEDAAKYVGHMGDNAISNLCRDSKQKNVDLVMMWHDFDDCPKSMRKLWDYLNIRKTSITERGLRDYRNKVPKFELVEIVNREVQESANKFANETIDVAV